MLNNIDKFTEWLSNNHFILFILLVIVTSCLLIAILATVIIFFPYALILVPVLTIYYTLHLYRKGDWK